MEPSNGYNFHASVCLKCLDSHTRANEPYLNAFIFVEVNRKIGPLRFVEEKELFDRSDNNWSSQ